MTLQMKVIQIAKRLCYAAWKQDCSRLHQRSPVLAHSVHCFLSHSAECSPCDSLAKSPPETTRFGVHFGEAFDHISLEKELKTFAHFCVMEQDELSTDEQGKITSLPIKISGSPGFSCLQFEKVPCPELKEPKSKKRRLSLSEDEQNCDVQTLKNGPFSKRKRQILCSSLLQKVSAYVRENADKVPQPEHVLDSGDLEIDRNTEQSKGETELGFMKGVLVTDIGASDKCEAELSDTAEPPSSEECSGLHLDDVYDVSPLFSNTWTDCEVKSRKKKNSEEQRSNYKSKKSKDNKEGVKKRPNYFVAIQVTNPQIHKELALVQDHIKKQEPSLGPAMIPLGTLHLTLLVLYLDKGDMERAREALVASGSRLRHLTVDPLTVTVTGIGNFKNNVIFAKVEEGEAKKRLHDVASCVSNCFAEHGLVSVDSKDFKAHLTILKLSRAPSLHKLGIKKVDPSLYQELTDTEFGKQTVSGLHLCAMLKPKDEQGYYHVEHAVQFVPNTYGAEDFSNDSASSEFVVAERMVMDAMASAIHSLRKQALEECRQRKLSAKSATKAEEAIQRALNELESRQETGIGEDSLESRKPKRFIAYLEKQLAWKFEIGDEPSKESIIKMIKSSGKK